MQESVADLAGVAANSVSRFFVFYDITIIVHISRQYILSHREVQPEYHCRKLQYAILFNDFLVRAYFSKKMTAKPASESEI